ncbi:hypothetical protein [Sneathiella chinensis]|uniref:hypothetical protein n=1 Tax=Sneathiella chinensis TaxID=349750 RepID=UPI00146F5A06|nr:hypothetical protein [Sneathiella chinensis]
MRQDVIFPFPAASSLETSRTDKQENLFKSEEVARLFHNFETRPPASAAPPLSSDAKKQKRADTVAPALSGESGILPIQQRPVP